MKKMSLLVLSMAIALSAAFVPVDRAKTVAENQYKQYCADASTKSTSAINVLEHKYEGETTWYMFEFDKGFVIVSADDAVRPILGYSDHGTVPSAEKWERGGQNFKEWFGYYDKQIAIARKTGYVDKAGNETWKNIENNVFSSSKAGIVVDRLLQSQYDQVWPWNDDCPTKVVSGDSTWTYVGCVATSMAQLLTYHKWPDVGVGSASYTWNNGTTNITLAANFATHTWNYGLMPEVLNIEYGYYPEYWESGITQAEVDELALQSYWVGLSVNMSYGDTADGGSGAYTSDSDNAFIDHWKGASTYASMATPAAPPTADALYATIKAQLDAKRPWQWSGGVHSFNLDGYRDDYWYHFNWGWAGSCDGWYHRSSLVPAEPGSGGGNGDYTAGQAGITYTPSTNPFTSFPMSTVSGSLANGEDVTVNWTAQTGATGYELYRTKDMEGNPTLVTTTTGLTFTQNDLNAGQYAYSVIVVYAAGKSHMSNAYSFTITGNSLLPPPTGVMGAANGRTSVDLTWTAPFVGVLNTYENFESGVWPTGWVKNTTANATPVWTGDPDGFMFFENGYPTWYYADRIEGWFVGKSSAATLTGWILSPTYTFNSSHFIKWWTRFRFSADGQEGIPNGSNPRYSVVTYAGTFSETKRESNIVYTTLKSYDNTSPENIWVFEEYCAIPAGTARVGFRCPVTTGTYSLGFDKITIGSPVGGGDAPNGFQIYRGNGTLAATLTNGAATGWSDTNFADGENSYYVKATFPTGTSLSSNLATATIDANPSPGFLSGTVSPVTQANLSWYIPYFNAPKWYSYFDPNTGNGITTLYDPASPINKKRTRFLAADLGFTYPVTLDSIGAIFIDENEGNWGGQNQFYFRVFKGYRTLADSIITLYHTSPTLTAVHGQLVKYKLPTPLVLTEDFNIEVVNTSGTDNPTNLMKAVEQSHSFNWAADETGAYNYFWSIIMGSLTYEWSFFGYITSSAPSKNGWVGKAEVAPETKTRAAVKPYPAIAPYTGKGIDYYKIYRNGTSIGTSTTVNYADSSVPATADYTYKVSAYYVDPVGESDFSNEIVLHVEKPISAPPTPTPITSSVVAGNVKFDWPDMAGATSYDVYSSATPYGTFALLTNVTVSEYTYTPTATRMFFQFVSKNSTKESPKTIEIARPVAR